MAKKPESVPLPRRCGKCYREDFVFEPGQGARRCDCDRGQQLAAADRERGLKTGAPRPKPAPPLFKKQD